MEYGAVIVWWAASVALAVAGLPIAATVLRRLPDRGAGLALPTAIVVLVVPVYWVGHVRFGPVALAAGLLVLGAASVGLAWRGADPRWRRFAEAVAVFTLAYLLLVAVRAVDPSILPAGGEKFLDFGLLNSVLRADSLPPEDMWFAGAPVQYYYGGHLISAVLATLSATPARYAYNLALAGFYASLVAAAYGVAGSVAAARGGPYRLAGGLGALFVGFASNLVAPLQVVEWVLPGAALANAVSGVTALEAGRLASPDAFFYWTASRVIRGTINEFPLFAFLNGDLHAHMMSTPFLLLVVGVALAYFLTPDGEVRRRRALVFGAVPPIGGLIAVVNTWSFPSVAGVAWLAVLFAPSAPSDLLPAPLARRLPEGEAARVGAATAVAAAVAALGVVWALPFFLGPATGAGGRSIGLVADRSGLVEFVLVHGWVVAAFGAYLGSKAVGPVDADRREVAGLLVGTVVVAGVLADAAAFGLLLPPFAVAWLLLRRGEVGFESVLFLAGAGLILLVELVHLEEQAGPGRMNTVFKTYMQVWVLWATGAAAALALLVRSRGASGALFPTPERRDAATRLFVAVLVASVSLYGAFALAGHFDAFGDRPAVGAPAEPTLDATEWAARTHPEEWEAIVWLGNRSGRPNIVTAPGCWCNPDGVRPYGWVNAPSSFTGVPTLAGWSHEVGYRGRATYERRVEDVRTIYTGTPDERARLLRDHDVRYVYVGPNERELYGDVSFDGPAFRVAFRNAEVTVYEVDRSAL